MTWYREWASTPKARKGRMLPLKAFDTILKYRDPGYASVYMFKEEDAQKLIDNESSIGMNKFEVGADCLTLDIDTGIEGLQKVTRTLLELGVQFDIYESGGKGFHIVIPHKFILDKRLPYSHKHFVTATFQQCLDHIDLTLYQHGRLISLPGRVHPYTKYKKTLVFRQHRTAGMELLIDLVDEPPKYVPQFTLDGDYDKLAGALFRAADLVKNAPETGNRHMRLWSTSKALAETGLDYPTVLALMNRINESWNNPKKATEVEAAVQSAFKNQT